MVYDNLDFRMVINRITRKKFIVASGLFFLISLLSICFILVFFYSYNEKIRGSEIRANHQIKYGKYYLVDPETGTFTYGGASIGEEDLGPLGFSSNELGNGKHLLVSNNGMTGFRCTGACFCDESSDYRRNSLSQTANGILYLVAATTSIIAYRHAKNYFETRCADELSSECETESIKSDVKQCRNILPSEPVAEVAKTDPGIGNRASNIFKCEGRCLPVSEFGAKADSADLNELQSRVKDFDCGRLLKKGEVVVDVATNFGQQGSLGNRDVAVLEFQRIHLNPFCHESSKYEAMYMGDEEGSGAKDLLGSRGRLCVGSYHEEVNPTVVCNQADWWGGNDPDEKDSSTGNLPGLF